MVILADNKFNLIDAVRHAAAAARAAAGDYTGLAVEGVRHARKIAGIAIGIVIGILLVFTTLISGITKLIPGFDLLYDMYRQLNPPSYMMDYTNTWQVSGSCESMYFPIPYGYEYSLPESNSKSVEIWFTAGTPVIAIENSRVLTVGPSEILLESLDGMRRYPYLLPGVNTIHGKSVNIGNAINYIEPVSGVQPPPNIPLKMEFQMWLNNRDKWMHVEPWQFLRMLSVNRYVLPPSEKEKEDENKDEQE